MLFYRNGATSAQHFRLRLSAPGPEPEERAKTKALLAATREYAQTLSNNQGAAMLADATGFAPEGVARAIAQLGSLDPQTHTG